MGLNTGEYDDNVITLTPPLEAEMMDSLVIITVDTATVEGEMKLAGLLS